MISIEAVNAAIEIAKVTMPGSYKFSTHLLGKDQASDVAAYIEELAKALSKLLEEAE